MTKQEFIVKYVPSGSIESIKKFHADLDSVIQHEAEKRHEKAVEYMARLRFDEKHHMGLGDIRMTIGQQEELARIAAGKK